MDSTAPEDSYSKIIKLIFDDAQQSIKSINDSINILNTKLTAVTGFSAAVIKFAGDLPDQRIHFPIEGWIEPLVCYSCLILKILSLVLLSLSTFIGLRALLPMQGGNDKIISPAEQVEKCLSLSEDEYRLLFIDISDKNIQSLVKLRDLKARQLSWSGEAFVAAAIVSAIDLILATVLKRG